MLPGRSGSSQDYRYGFNGKEDDGEIKGKGNSLDFGARMYDSRIGRWFAVDKMRMKAPDWSPYRFSFDNPIRYKDTDGNWEEDGHFWTVYAMGVAMGLSKTHARYLAVYAEYYDHIVHDDGTMSIHPHKSGLGWGKDGGLGTWADSNLQKSWHGLTGGAHSIVLSDAISNVLMGDYNQLHKVGDAFSHSYLNKKGVRIMYGSTTRYLPGLGNITLEHAFEGPDGHENADIINKRPKEYKLYIDALVNLYNNPNFVYNQAINKNPNLSIFDYVQKNGVTKENNIFLLSSFIELNNGKSEFKFLNDKQSTLLRGYLDQEGIKYEFKSNNIEKKDMDGKVVTKIENNSIKITK